MKRLEFFLLKYVKAIFNYPWQTLFSLFHAFTFSHRAGAAESRCTSKMRLEKQWRVTGINWDSNRRDWGWLPG
jgi:hypothetical protein